MLYDILGLFYQTIDGFPLLNKVTEAGVADPNGCDQPIHARNDMVLDPPNKVNNIDTIPEIKDDNCSRRGMENDGNIIHQRKERIAHWSELKRNFDNYMMPGTESEKHTTIDTSPKPNTVRDVRKLFNRLFGAGGYQVNKRFMRHTDNPPQ